MLSFDLIKDGVIVQFPGLAIALYFFRIKVKESRLETFREEIKSRNFTDKDLQELSILTRKRSSDSKNVPAKFITGLGVIALPVYSWMAVNMLEFDFSGASEEKLFITFLPAAAFILLYALWLTAVVEQVGSNYKYKEISEVLEGIQIDRVMGKYPAIKEIPKSKDTTCTLPAKKEA